jgi:hypothetical protein
MRMEDEQAFQSQVSAVTGSVADSSEITPWTEDDIVRLHGYLLEKSLHDLFDLRASAATRAEVLEWLLAPKGRSNAFSFMACCRLFGINSEEILERVLKRYRQRRTH